jgi:hypothetical protein
VNNITSAMLVGANAPGAPTGVYAFSGSGISDLNVMDLSDPNQESVLTTFALSQGIYVHLSGAPSETVAAAVTNLATTGTDSPFAKRLLGDWVYRTTTTAFSASWRRGCSRALSSPRRRSAVAA